MRFAFPLAVCASALIATGCSRDKEPAQQAVASAETALNQVRPQAQQYAPEHLQTVETELDTMKKNLENQEYKAVLRDSKTFNADVVALNDAVVAKQTQLAAATHEWEQLSQDVPKNLQAIEAHVGNMKGKKAQDARAQPDPWIVTAASVIWDRNAAKPPKVLPMISSSSPVGSPPPSGLRFVQNTEWSTCPETLNARFRSSIVISVKSPFDRISSSFANAVFAPVTYAAWCLPWCSSLISPMIAGSRSP